MGLGERWVDGGELVELGGEGLVEGVGVLEGFVGGDIGIGVDSAGDGWGEAVLYDGLR